MEIVRELDEQLWREYVDGHPLGNIFHVPEMFQVFARTRGYRPSLWAAVESSGRPLALMLPVQVTLTGKALRWFTTRAILYGSVLCALGADGRKALESLLRIYNRENDGVLFTELRNLSDLSDFQTVLQDNGFVYKDHLNYLIDLNRPVDQVLQGIGRRTRKKIRKGLRDEFVQITDVANRAELDQWYDTLQMTYGNAQVPLADSSLFEAAFDVLYPKGMAKLLLAKVDGITAACSIELAYKDTLYGWYGGSDRSYSKYLPNEMLVWHVLEWGASNGYRLYDFGGAGNPDEEYGVRDFKAKFGGELVCYGRNTCVHAPRRLWLSQCGYSIFRRWL